MLNITLNGIKKIKCGSPSEQRWSQSVRNKRDFNPNFISCKALVYLVKGNKSVALIKYPWYSLREVILKFEKVLYF